MQKPQLLFRKLNEMKTLLLVCLLPFQAIAQNISGIWTGSLESTGTNLTYEVVISESTEKITGYALTVFMFNGVENMGIKSIKLKRKNETLSLEDGEMIYDNYSTPPRRVKLIGNLFLRAKDSVMTLNGTFFTRSLDFMSQDKTAVTGTIHLQRQNNNTSTRLVSKLDELNLLNAFSFVTPKTRTKEPVIEIVTSEDVPMPSQKQLQRRIDLPEQTFVKTLPPILNPKERKLVLLPPVIAIVSEPLPEPKELQKQLPVVAKTVTVAKIQAPPSPKQKVIVRVTPLPPVINTIPSTPPAAAALAERKTEIIRSVPFSSDSLLLSLYDNGTIDGDTVSVVLNGNVIIAKKRLTANAIRTTVYVTPDLGDSLQLVMYAENLGSIPPNTGLLIIQDGDNRNEIRFEGDLRKSSAIILRRRR